MSYRTKVPSLFECSVGPLLKRGDPLQPGNYRPVALLPVLSKVLERVVYGQVVQYLESNNLLHPNHHGSRAEHSTSTACIQMYDEWVNSIEENEMAESDWMLRCFDERSLV